MSSTHKFVSNVLKSKLIGSIVDELICPMPFDPQMQGNLNITLADYMVRLLLLGFTLNPSNMDAHLPKVQNVISSLQGIKNILLEDTPQQIERLEIALKVNIFLFLNSIRGKIKQINFVCRSDMKPKQLNAYNNPNRENERKWILKVAQVNRQ